MGGGGGQPTTNTTNTSNIPEYAKPYVTNMLSATQQQLFNGTPNAEGGMDITGFKPYQPYSTDVNKYFAGFSPMQQQAQQATANLQTPDQYNQATGLTQMAGLGALGAGQQYAQQATNPNAVAQYMSPYMQNVVDYQKGQALHDFQMAQPMRNQQAIAAGAFGGTRQALVNAEAQRNLNIQLQGIEAQGAQNAFQNAQQAQQFGANLGLQGLGQAGQMAGQLASIGGQQLGAQQNIINAQNQMGAQQQALEQSKINQAIQDYATAQQYPLMQLGFMSNMLHGLPMQATTTQTYQNPNVISQLGGLGATALGAYGASGGFRTGATGGLPKDFKRSKAKRYDVGGSIKASLYNMAEMDPTALAKEAKSNPSPMIRAMAEDIIREKAAEEQASQGIAGSSVDLHDMAAGGIVAFAPGGNVSSGTLGTVKKFLADEDLQAFGAPTEEENLIREGIAKDRARIEGDKERNFWQAVMMGGAKTMAGTSPNALANIGEGIATGVGQYGAGEKTMQDQLNRLRAGELDLAKLNTTQRNNLLHYALSAASTEEASKLRALTAGHNKTMADIARQSAADTKRGEAITKQAQLYLGLGPGGNRLKQPTQQEVNDAIASAEKWWDDKYGSSNSNSKKPIKIPD